MLDQSVHTSDDVDIGDIDALSRDFIVIKRGYLMNTITIFQSQRRRVVIEKFYG